jgi:hypothetical protein
VTQQQLLAAQLPVTYFLTIYKNKPAAFSIGPFVVISFIYKVLVLLVNFSNEQANGRMAAFRNRAGSHQKRYQ